MYLKLAMLLLFGFVALAVAVPLEDTEEKVEPAEPVAADAEKPEAPLEESEAPESEDETQEDAEDEPETDDNEDEPDNEVEAKDEDGNDKRGRYIFKVCRHLRGGVCYRKKKCYRRRVGRYTDYCCRVGPRVCRIKYARVCVFCRRCRKRRHRPRLVCRLRKVCRRYVCHYFPHCSCPCRFRG